MLGTPPPGGERGCGSPAAANGFNRSRAPRTNMRAESPAAPCEDGAHAEEFYGLYGRTRLMLAREFESFGAGRGEAVGSAQDLLDRLVAAFFAGDSAIAPDRDAFEDGVIGALGGRLDGSSERVWSYVVGDFLPGIAGAFSRHRICAPGGMPLDAPLPPYARFRDMRGAGFFDGLAASPRRGAATAAAAATAGGAAARRGGVSPVVLNLLAMSSHGLGGRDRAVLLGRMLERSMSDLEEMLGMRHSRRKREGVFYTPPYVARCMCRDTIVPWLSASGNARDPSSLVAEHAEDLAGLEGRLRRIRVLDPACGSGAFLIEAAGVLLDVHAGIGARRAGRHAPAAPGASALEAVWGCLYGMDQSPRSVEAARLALLLLAAAPGAGRPRPPRLPDLSRSIVVRDSVANLEGGWDAEFPDVFRGGGFDVIVGNPPYVRHEELRDKASLALPDPAALGLPPGFRIPSTSDLGAYFHYHSLCHLAEGGRLGFIASDGWLSHSYGLSLQRALLENCRIDAIVRPAFNVFGDADIRTAVLLLAKLPARGGHRMRFATIGRPGDLDNWRRCIVARLPQGGARPGNWSAQFVGATPPPRIPMTTAASAGRVESCVKTGRNGFFVLAPDEARRRGIAGRFLRPVLSSGTPDGCLAGRDAGEYLLSVDLTLEQLSEAGDGEGALRYIKGAESMPVAPRKGSHRAERRMQDLASVRERSPWHSLGLGGDPPPIFLSIFMNRRNKVYRNDGRFFARNNFAAFVPADPSHADALCAYFASSWFALHMEKNGHVAGGGALQFLVGDFRRAPVPDLGRMNPRDVERLGSAWNGYCAEPDRGRLDDAVLEVMGFCASERAGVARQLGMLVSSRTGGGGGGGAGR